MLDELKSARKVVGVKQSERSVVAGEVSRAYIAKDAHERVTAPFMKQCRENNVSIVMVESMAELGHACGIDVGAAVVAVLK